MRIMIIAVLALLNGCGTTGTIQATVAPADTLDLVFVDNRPTSERTGSTFRDSSGTDVHVYGDDSITPSPPVLFKSWLSHHGPSGIAGKTLYLHRFEVRVEDPSASISESQFSQAASVVPGGGILGVLLARTVVGGIENSQIYKYVHVTIDGSIEQWPFKIHSKGSFTGRVTEDEIMTVIDAALAKTKAEIERRITR